MSTITTINANDNISDSRSDINTNFANLNSDKIETSVLDTDTTLAANSDSKIATQKAVKAYVDSGGNSFGSETSAGIYEEATDAEVAAGNATGGTGAKLVVTPAKLATHITTLGLDSINQITLTAGEDIAAKDAVYMSSGESTGLTINSSTTGNNLTPTSTTWHGQTFVTSSDTYFITGVTFEVAVDGGGGSSATISLRATSAGLPTGANLGSIAGVSTAASGTKTATFSSPVAVSPSTTYAFFIAQTAGGSCQLEASNTSVYASGSVVSSTDSGASWSADTNKDLYSPSAMINEVRIASGQIGKAVDNGTTRETGFIGFAESAISRTASGTVIIAGHVTGVSTSAGAIVTLSDTPGAITTGNTKKIGVGISATELVIANQL